MTIESMVLSAKEQHDLIQWEKSWGKESAQGREHYLKIQKYKDTFLNKQLLSRGKPYNCYHEGVDLYTRKDGQPLTAEDVRAIYEGSPGQGSKVLGKAGDLEVKHEWFIDSSD